ncbi:MAG: response regulator transcription factor [Campylobacterota bacterium]|nr:response regulator transcription factor [Campylobacterota bacterium]
MFTVKILFLEDDALFSESVCDFLDECGYEVEHFFNGNDALDASYEKKYDLYLLDINVPLLDGVTLLKELRLSNDKTPAIFLTSHNTKEMLMSGYEAGVDDYIKKPCDLDELHVRVEALLRRNGVGELLHVNNITLDDRQKRVLVDGETINLSLKEYELAKLFLSSPNEVITKEIIIDTLWCRNESVSDGSIRVYITRIKNSFATLEIENIRGLGYRLNI